MNRGLAQLKSVGNADAIQLDVSDKGAVTRAAADIEKRHGRIDILVTSAGTNIGGAKRNFKSMSARRLGRRRQINLTACSTAATR